jgi:hypothetical protein
MRSFSRRRALVLLAILAGCGGKTGDSDNPPGDTGGTDAPTDTPPVRAGWHSYDATITDGHVDWSGGGGPSPGGLPSTFTTKWKGRIDLHATTGGVIDRAVIAPPFEDATEYRAGAGGALVAVGDAYGVSFVSDGDTHMSAHVSSLTVSGGTITGAGDANYFEGDVGWSGKSTFTIVRVEDTTAPKWILPTKGAFADLPLPWEEQQLLIEEPVDGDKAGPTFTSTLHASLSAMETKPRWLGDTEALDSTHVRGLRIVTDQWDAAPSWKIGTPALSDFAHNALPSTSLAPTVASVPALESPTLSGTADPKLGHVWGKLAVDPKCYDGTTACWRLGSIKASYCSYSTQAGIAVVLSGSAKRVAVEVRIVAVPTISGVGGTPPTGSIAHLQMATPGVAAVTEAIAFGDGTTTAGTWDSGWKRVEKPLPASASSAGVALSLGGLGNFGGSTGTDCGGGPAPPPWDLDMYVRLIEILP